MNKKKIVEHMLNQWFAEKIYEDIVFYKHIQMKKRSSIYQIVLSGTIYDGVYEINVGDKFQWNIDEEENVVVHNSTSMESAVFKTRGAKPAGYMQSAACGRLEYTIIRSDYENEESFKKALLDTNFITEEEYDTYTFKNTQEDIYSKVPKIGFVA